MFSSRSPVVVLSALCSLAVVVQSQYNNYGYYNNYYPSNYYGYNSYYYPYNNYPYNYNYNNYYNGYNYGNYYGGYNYGSSPYYGYYGGYRPSLFSAGRTRGSRNGFHLSCHTRNCYND
ncbi:hypothetical protein AAVH_29332 [Aphelenchoides avenae]|nr:hypothetical protein AAVH_29332 [Aphelenchus avenae]